MYSIVSSGIVVCTRFPVSISPTEKPAGGTRTGKKVQYKTWYTLCVSMETLTTDQPITVISE